MDQFVTASAVMTAPRYESVYARNQIEKALRSVGVPLTISGGVYYGQCMETMLEQLVDLGNVDYAITVDFDSIFEARDVSRLLSLMAQEPQIDAIAAVQPKRGFGTIMATNGETESLVYTGKPIKVRSAHFGLTVLDLDKLQHVPKPWFCAKPDEYGGWGESRTDADVSFWRSWEGAGNSLYIDPGTRLGHLEEMISMFDENMQLVHLYPKEWESECQSNLSERGDVGQPVTSSQE